MNELTDEIKFGIVLQHSGAVTYLTQKEQDMILHGMSVGAKGFTLSGNWLSFGSISDIMSLEEYYRKFPDKIPASAKEFKIEDDRYQGLTIEQIAELDQYRFKDLLKGLKKYIDEQLSIGKKPKNAIETYNEKLERYKKRFNRKVEETL